MRRFLKWKWLVSFGLLLVMMAVTLPLAYLWNQRQQDRLELQKIIAQLDVEDPNWKLDDLVNEHNTKLPPSERNPATITRQAYATLPAGWSQQSRTLDGLTKLPVNCVHPKPDHDAYVRVLKTCEPTLQLARQLVGYSEGGRAIQMTRSPVEFNNNELQNTREIARLLNHDVVIAASEGRTGDAIQSARAGLGVARACGTEPSSISQLVRIAADAVAVSSVERILNLGEPKAGLAELQADLLQQSKFPYLLHMSRIGRAETDRYFDMYTAGELSDFANTPTVNNYLSELQITQNLALNHAVALKMMNQQVAICQLPLQQQYEALKAIPSPRDGDRRYMLAILFTMGRERILDSCFRIQGQLAAAAVGVACERYRQKFGQWPATLDMIPKNILAEIPLDPFTGKPIVYKRLPDGIAVYTVGPDLTDDGGVFYDPATGDKGTDFGIEIYDPALRRLQAPLKPAEGAEPEQP